jgi:hypothetical protein
MAHAKGSEHCRRGETFQRQNKRVSKPWINASSNGAALTNFVSGSDIVVDWKSAYMPFGGRASLANSMFEHEAVTECAGNGFWIDA